MNELATTDNPNKGMTVRGTTALAAQDAPSVLGEGRLDIPTDGKVRPGIMILVGPAAKNPKAIAAYERGVKQGLPYKVIMRDIKKEAGLDDRAYPLAPANVPYFTVRGDDFSNPAVAKIIFEKFAEDRGDGLHLYRIPVVFPSDNWLQVLPHGLNSFKTNERVFWSEYGPDRIRYCMVKAPLQFDEKSKRYKKTWGGRKAMLNPAMPEGKCDPENCPVYQDGKCKLSGNLIFYVPGVPGSSALKFNTTSFYGMDQMRLQLQLMLSIRGRISGMHDRQPMFWLTKRHEEVSMLDLATGQPKKVMQWITVLEGAVDMTKVLTAPEHDEDDFDEEHAALSGPDHEYEESDFIIDGESSPYDDQAAPDEFTVPEIKDMILGRLKALQVVTWPEFEAYALEVYGGGDEAWKENLDILSRILSELDAVEDEESAKAQYREKVLSRRPF